ncbi:hypothetical protein [Desulfovibrio sp. ZJ369]|uniref:hypothetical protein n=1 Tax=Desulfovibrio sp. ZJ369 TaxID=2709793 RepID=UPI0013E9F5C4|nr:hypothetical protein [Desulfovibrio sp. ZJ369]
MDQVFNELSLSASLPDNHAAHAVLLELKKASDKLKALGFSPQIRVTEDFAVRHITLGCTIRDYLKSPAAGKDKTLRQWLLMRFSSVPFVEQLCINAGMTILEEYVIGEDVCKGLALASLWDIPALSLAGDARFVPPHVILTRNSLNEADSAVSEEECQVGLICREDDIPPHEKSIKALFCQPTNTGQELLDYAHRQLTYLIFSPVAEGQLRDMPKGYVWLPRIRKILEELQRAMQEAVETGQAFAPRGFNYTPAESDTATQGKKGKKHTFSFEDTDAQGNAVQRSLLCESHMRITDGDRVYFYADTGKETVYVGHVGEHLPGKKYG